MDDDHLALREGASAINPRIPSEVERLRRDWPVEMVRIAIELAEARRAAAKKFGDETAGRMVCDVLGVEQASSLRVARYKAKRFGELSSRPSRIVDLCCGIGGDAMALKDIAPVVVVDKSDVRAWMAGINAGCETIVQNAEEFNSCEGDAVHIDPDRRAGASGTGGARVWRYEDYQPGPAFLERLIADKRDVCIKLGPGVDFAALPFLDDVAIEVISEAGNLVQALAWGGGLAKSRGKRTATLLIEGDENISFTGGADEPIPVSPVGRFVYTVDASIERAELLGAFCGAVMMKAVHPKLGLLTSDEYITKMAWLTGFEVMAQLPWRVKKVKQWLREHDAGIVEVKTRGKAVDPDVAQQQLRGSGDQPFTVFVLRIDKNVHAYICKRV